MTAYPLRTHTFFNLVIIPKDFTDLSFKRFLRLLFAINIFVLLFNTPVDATTISYISNAGYINYNTDLNYYGSTTLTIAATYQYKAYLELPVYGETIDLHIYSNGQGGGCSSSCFYINNVGAFDQLTLKYSNQPAFYGTILTLGNIGTGWHTYTINNAPRYIGISESGFGSSFTMDSHFGTNPPYITSADLNYSNTNTILISTTTDYNNTATSTNNSNIYVTTFVNNSNWAFWSPVFTHLSVVKPNGAEVNIGTVWGQNAYQIAVDLDSLTPIGSPYGVYQFKLYNCLICSPSNVLATKNVTYNNPALADSTISLDIIGNNVTGNYWVNNIMYPNINLLTYEYTYDRFYPNAQNGISLFSSSGTVQGFNGSKDLTNTIVGSPFYYFYGESVIINAYVKYNGIVIATDSKSYQFFIGLTPTPTPTPTPVITPITVTPTIPIPSPTATYTPQPTFTPIPGDENASAFNQSPMGNLGDMANISNASLGNIHAIAGDSINQINAYDYSTSKNVFTTFLPAIFNMIHPKLWGLIILGWAFEISLILWRR